jgi:hypothetical protein
MTDNKIFDNKISILTDLRECAFGAGDFKMIFSEMEKYGKIDCVRFYNYVGGDAKLDEFIIENDYEALPKAVRTNDIDSRLVIDSVSLCKRDAKILAFINVKDDDLLIEYLTSLGASVFAVKGGGVEQDVFELYDKVFVFFGTHGDDERIIRAVYEKTREESVDGGIAADSIDGNEYETEVIIAENIDKNTLKNEENIDENGIKNAENIAENDTKNEVNTNENDGENDEIQIENADEIRVEFEIKIDEVKIDEIKTDGKKKVIDHKYVDEEIIAIFDRLLKKR